MASADITSIVIQAKSDGISDRTAELKNLTSASNDTETAVGKLNKTLASANTTSSTNTSVVEKLLAAEKKRTDLLGANISQQLAYNVAIKGGTDAQVLIAQQLGAQQDAYKRLAADQAEAIKMNKAYNASLQETGASSGHAAGGISGITREFIVLGHEAVSGNFSRIPGSMMVLAERVQNSANAMEMLGAAAQRLGGFILNFLLNPITLVIGALVAMAGAAVSSAKDFDLLNNSLIMTGNYAGATVSQLENIAQQATKTGSSISTTRNIVADFASTGKFTADQISQIAPALAELEHATGNDVKSISDQFKKIAESAENTTNRSSDAVARAVLSMNGQYHLLSTEQFTQVQNLEAQGKALDAVAVAFKGMTDEIKRRSHNTEESFTWLGKQINDLKAGADASWESLKRLFSLKNPDLGTQLKETIEQLNIVKINGDPFGQAKDLAAKIGQLQAQIQQQTVASEKEGQATRLANQEQFAQQSLQRTIDNNNKQASSVRALNKLVEDYNNSSQEYQLSHLKEFTDTYLKLYQDSLGNKKVKAMGFADINLEISKIKEQTQAQIEADTLVIESAKNLYALKKIDILAEQQIIDTAIRHKIEVENAGYAKEQEAIKESMAVRGRTATEIKELQNRAVQDTSTHEKAVTALNKALMENSIIVETDLTKAYNDENAANQKVVDGIKQKTADLKAQNEAYAKLPESIRAAGVTDKQMRDAVTQAKIDALTAENDALQKNSEKDNIYTQQKIDNNKKIIDSMNDERAQQVIREAQQATNKAAQDYVTAWNQANKQIGDDLASAIIDGGGKGWRKLINDMKLAFAKLILNPIIAPISSEIASVTAMLSPSSASAASGGNSTGAVGLAQTASSVYSAITKGFDGIGTMVANGVQKGFNTLGTSNAQAIGNSELAQTVGEYAGKAAGFAIGQTLNKTISGQYQVGSGFSKVETVATAVASYFGPQFGAIAGAVSGLINRAFGMGSKNITSQGISGTIADTGVTGESYQNWSQKGGWFRSDKSGKETQALTTDVMNTFSSGLTSLKAASTDFAKNLNVGAGALENYSKTFDITLTNDSAANQKAITDFFTTMGDDMATKLVPNIADFAKQGETASVTLQRLSDTFKTTNAVMDLFGINSEKVFGGLGLESAKARQYLVDLAGGISNLGSQASFYAQNFLSAQEQIAPVQKAVVAAMAELGHSEVTTVEGFKALVNSLNLVDPAQAQLFESLMQLAPAFKQVTDAADAATQAAKDQAAADKTLLMANIDTLKNKASYDFSVLQQSVQTQKNLVQSNYDAQVAILNAQVSSLTTVQTNINSLSTALDSALNSMIDNTSLAMSRATAQGLLDQALAEAKKGNLPSAESMKGTLSTLGKDASGSFSSFYEYQKDLGITAGKVNELNDITKKQGSIVEQQLQVAKDQLSQAKTTYDAEMKRLDTTLQIAQQQLDAMNGTTIAVKDLSTALSSFAASVSVAIGTQHAAGIVGSNGSVISATAATGDTISSVYQSLLGRAPDAQGYANALDWASHGGTALALAENIMKSPEYARLHGTINGSHANGLDNVPFDGYTAKLHKGEMVLPAKQAKGVIQGEDMKAVVDAINNLCADNSAENRSLVSDIKWLRKLFQNMAPSNDRLQVHDIGAA